VSRTVKRNPKNQDFDRVKHNKDDKERKKNKRKDLKNKIKNFDLNNIPDEDYDDLYEEE